MTQVMLLEDFGSSPSFPPSENYWADENGQTKDNSAARTEGFDQGYKAGWDDAVKAEAENQLRISAEFARNLQDLGFTFHEAKIHVLKTLDQFLQQIVETLLPDVVAQSIGHLIIQELTPMAQDVADAPIQITIHPATRPALETLLEEASAMQLEIIDEPSLGMGQVNLKAAKSEKIIDMQAVLQNIASGVETMQAINAKESRYG
ncbi:MAG: flagellar biosynthesis protein [Marinosulfonomonas sp.]|nr:flagellar biosynthesis protein [Marinosulfonomonas sp.]